ncbi:MAG TPA: XdhC/CoxI family protein [Candidatus Acidoferrum sp.]|nr:XdhC/CoxI family protein [Candidatus Acidoferrum sp.]
MSGLHEKYLAGIGFDLTFMPPGTSGGEPYVRRFRPPVRLIILGGGYVGQALCRFASALEFEVTAVDDRPAFANYETFSQAKLVLCDAFSTAISKLGLTADDFVAVVTRGHRHDADCLRVILQGEMPAYLGLIGSRRRVAGLFDMLEGEGLDRARMDLIHTPIGLPIGAVTPDEIAISILAELTLCRSGRASDRHTGILEQTNVDPDFLRCLDMDGVKAVALVVERRGSTPVKTGAVMAVDPSGRTFGTVGGGCGEHEIVLAALRVLQTGRDELVTVDMTDEVAKSEGMVCGGTMKVLITKIDGPYRN